MARKAVTPAGDPTTIPELKAAYAERERALYLCALERHGWNAHRAATELHVTAGAVQKAIDRHGLRKLYAEHGPGAGRPKAPPAAEPSDASSPPAPATGSPRER